MDAPLKIVNPVTLMKLFVRVELPAAAHVPPSFRNRPLDPVQLVKAPYMLAAVYPVVLARLPLAGVPSAGVVSVGLVSVLLVSV